jgi:hypothetical protein
MSTSPNLLITDISASQDQKEVTHNAAIHELDLALTNLVSIGMGDADVTLTTGEGNQALANMVFVFTGSNTAARNVVVPTNKKLYVVKNSTTGGFKITIKTSSGTGVDVLSTDGYVIVYCDGTNVVAVGGSGVGGGAIRQPLGGFIGGTFANSQVLAFQPVDVAYNFAANFAGSYAYLLVAATASTVFVINKIVSGTPTQIGTITFAIGGTVGTWASTSGATQSLAAGDIFQVVAPSSADATAAGLGFIAKGTN